MREQIWTCKIGGTIGQLPPGADLPLRHAVEEAFKKLTGTDNEFCFSGWDGELDEMERLVAEGVFDDEDEKENGMNYENEKLASKYAADVGMARIGPASDFDIIRRALNSLQIENENLRQVIDRLQIKADAFDTLVSFQRSTQHYVGEAGPSCGYDVYMAEESLGRLEREATTEPGENIADLDASDLTPEADEGPKEITNEITNEEILRRLQRIAEHIGIPSSGTPA